MLLCRDENNVGANPAMEAFRFFVQVCVSGIRPSVHPPTVILAYIHRRHSLTLMLRFEPSRSPPTTAYECGVSGADSGHTSDAAHASVVIIHMFTERSLLHVLPSSPLAVFDAPRGKVVEFIREQRPCASSCLVRYSS